MLKIQKSKSGKHIPTPEFSNPHSFNIFAAKMQQMANNGKYGKNSTLAVISFYGSQENAQSQDSLVSSQDTIQPPKPNRVQKHDPSSQYLSKIDDIALISTDTLQPAQIVLPAYHIKRYNTDWLTIILLLSLVLLTTVRVSFANYIGSLFQSVVNYSTSFRMFREKNYSILHGASRLEALYYVIFSLFLFQILVMYSFSGGKSGILFYGKTLGFVILYFVVKKMIYKLLGIIFKGESETSEFLFSIDNFNRVTGIVLIPIVALLAFYPYESIDYIALAGGVAVVGLYIFLLQRGLAILLKKQFPIFYLFLYLCILEFLPLLLIFKIVVE